MKLPIFCFFSFVFINGINGNNQHRHKILKTLRHINSKTPVKCQYQSVLDLINRIVPNHADQFEIKISKYLFHSYGDIDGFQIESLNNGKILITGTDGVSAAAGFYHYMKYWCKAHISWSGYQLKLPKILPKVESIVKKSFNEKYRYYQNVCTVSYSMVYWNWTRWEQEIDWMAMNGINFPLAFTGQETIWQMIYKKVGLTQEELDQHFAGPAFLAWQRMGNLDGWGGPLPNSWYEQQLNLQHNILKRMRSFGMIPVLPGFAGHVPKPLIDRIYPDANYYQLDPWNGFGNGTYLLDAQDPLYQKIGSLFISTQKEIYNGTDHVYNADVFNEMEPPESSTEYISNTSKAIYNAMIDGDKDAVWLMQGWMFLNKYWKDELIQAWLSAVPFGKIIILDLASDIYPIYKRTHGYFGYPYIWNMIENFGGNTRVYGKNIDNIKNLFGARQDKQLNSSLIGIGMTPEGIEQNDINFEVLNELAWRKKVFNMTTWANEYIERRYGTINTQFEAAYSLLINTIYNSKSGVQNGGYRGHGRVPVMEPIITDKLDPIFWYQPADVLKAWKLMVEGCFENDVEVIDTLIHDIARLGTQMLEDMLVIVYENLIKAYHNKDGNEVQKNGQLLINVLKDMDTLLSTDQYSLLGNWIESAKSLGVNQDEKNILEFNARNQITLWGPDGQISDYANKNWAGLVETYYANRWTVFIDEIYSSTEKGHTFNNEDYKKRLTKFQVGWNNDKTVYTRKPQGDALLISRDLITKYGNKMFTEHKYEISKLKHKLVGNSLKRINHFWK